MKTLHIHNSKKRDCLNSFLLLIPIFIFGLVLITYIFIKGEGKSAQVTAESNPNLGSKENKSWVLGDQDSLDNTDLKSLK